MHEEIITLGYLEEWLNKLKTAWSLKDFGLVEELFTRCVNYVEAPFITPGRNISDIKNFWAEVIYHSDVHLSYEIIVFYKNKAVVNYFARYFDGVQYQQSNGIYVIDFDHEGYCTTFKQWSVVMK